MDKKRALQEIMRILERCEGDIESILDDLYQDAYDDGYDQRMEEEKKVKE